MSSKLYVNGTQVPYVVIKDKDGNIINSKCQRVRVLKDGVYQWVISQDITITVKLNFAICVTEYPISCDVRYVAGIKFESIDYSIDFDSSTKSFSISKFQINNPPKKTVGINYSDGTGCGVSDIDIAMSKTVSELSGSITINKSFYGTDWTIDYGAISYIYFNGLNFVITDSDGNTYTLYLYTVNSSITISKLNKWYESSVSVSKSIEE